MGWLWSSGKQRRADELAEIRNDLAAVHRELQELSGLRLEWANARQQLNRIAGRVDKESGLRDASRTEAPENGEHAAGVALPVSIPADLKQVYGGDRMQLLARYRGTS
ncbi:MAG: hypothetical protein ACRDGM_11845 [bacterium]